jgi:membrane protease YdiL (CAAX protease family)
LRLSCSGSRSCPGSTPAEASAVNIFLKPALTAWLAFAGFAVRKRQPRLFRIRGFGWRGFGAMMAILAGLYLLLYLGTRLFPSAAAGPASGTQAGLPLALGTAGAFAARISEEVSFRAFAIEELSEVFGSRWLPSTPGGIICSSA